MQKKQGEHIQGDVRVLNQLNVETPFTDVRDALQRLLPFHVSQAQFHCNQQLISTQGCQQQLQNTNACTSHCQRYWVSADPKTPASIGSSAGSCRTQNVAAHDCGPSLCPTPRLWRGKLLITGHCIPCAACSCSTQWMLLKLTWTTPRTTWCGTAASCRPQVHVWLTSPAMASLSMIKFFKKFRRIAFPCCPSAT